METDKLKEIISNYKYQLDILNTKLYHNECRQNFFHCLYLIIIFILIFWILV